MRNSLIMVSLVFSTLSYTQTKFITTGEISYKWVEKVGDFVEIDRNSANNIFWFSEDYTQFHNVGRIEQTWYVIGEMEKDNNLLFFSMVTIEDMKDFELIINTEKDTLIINFDLGGITYLVMYSIVEIKLL